MIIGEYDAVFDQSQREIFCNHLNNSAKMVLDFQYCRWNNLNAKQLSSRFATYLLESMAWHSLLQMVSFQCMMSIAGANPTSNSLQEFHLFKTGRQCAISTSLSLLWLIMSATRILRRYLFIDARSTGCRSARGFNERLPSWSGYLKHADEHWWLRIFGDRLFRITTSFVMRKVLP